MADDRREPQRIGDPVSEGGTFPIDAQYDRIVTAFTNMGVVVPLPSYDNRPGLIVGGMDTPLPSREEMHDLFDQNAELVEVSIERGYTELLLTPFGPIEELAETTANVIKAHAEAGTIFEAKANPDDPDVPVEVDTENPVSVSDLFKGTFRSWREDPYLNQVFYFPERGDSTVIYGNQFPGSLIPDSRVVGSSQYCAFPGWTVGLIDPSPQLSQKWGRRGIERSPEDYYAALGRTYGRPSTETGWTIQDFLTHFAVNLASTNQVSHDIDQKSGTWLLESFILGSVAQGGWSRKRQRLEISGGLVGDPHQGVGARFMRRLTFSPQVAK